MQSILVPAEAYVTQVRANAWSAQVSETADPANAQRVSRVMHWWFLLDTVLVFIAGVQLFVLSEFTEYFFAWTIQSPLTAAVLGAAYWGALPFVFFAWRARLWARARVAVFGVLAFTALSFALTLIHFNRFHLNSPNWTAQIAFWAWLVVYALVPPGLLVGWLLQRREPGQDPPRTRPLPSWYRAALIIQAAIMLLVGAALFFLPAVMIPLWFWPLTPLTAGAIGAWSIGVGLTVAHAAWENDWTRITGAAVGSALLGVLELIALVRYANELNWASIGAWLFALFMVALVVQAGIAYWLKSRASTV